MENAAWFSTLRELDELCRVGNAFLVHQFLRLTYGSFFAIRDRQHKDPKRLSTRVKPTSTGNEIALLE